MHDHHEDRWYGLFSRGARDWLRHNQKIRAAVRENLPRLIAEADVITADGERRVRMPVRFLEHHRFKLAREGEQSGVGQGGNVKPGDILRPAQPQPDEGEEGTGAGGSGNGGFDFVLEMKLDEIIDWLWEELALPDLQPRHSSEIEDDQWQREGWNKRGARARLDRRRTLKEAVKRRAVTEGQPAFIDEDLRYRQLRRRPQPDSRAVVLFGLDASSSMGERERVLAKSFFFWALQGVRRRYPRLDTAFIGHTVEAWEFSEEEFFQVSGQGGTVASTCFDKALEILDDRYDPASYNIYFFYASDGENFPDDHQSAVDSLTRLQGLANFSGYVEVGAHGHIPRYPETSRIFDEVIGENGRGGRYSLHSEDDVWEAIRAFFTQQAEV